MAATPIRPRSARRPRPGRDTGKFADSFALLAECLLTGVYVLIASLPVITLPAALAAGVAHLDRHLVGHDTQIGRFAGDWWAAVKDLWTLGLGVVVLAAVLAGNVRIANSGLLPGGDAVRWLSLAVGTIAAILVLRAAGLWAAARAGSPFDGTHTPHLRAGIRPGQAVGATTPRLPDDVRTTRSPDGARAPIPAPPRGWDLTRRAAHLAGQDPGGSALLGVAVGLSGVLVWMLAPLAAVVGGLLSLAVVAVESRGRSVSRPADSIP